MVDLRTIDFASSKVVAEKLDFALEVGGQTRLENPRAVAYVLGWQRAKRRSGSANTKLMSEISGTTAKPHKQKGTGSARQGSKRSVQFRGGRTCFGPRARSFDFSLPKKIIKTAEISLLNYINNSQNKNFEIENQHNNFLNII